MPSTKAAIQPEIIHRIFIAGLTCGCRTPNVHRRQSQSQLTRSIKPDDPAPREISAWRQTSDQSRKKSVFILSTHSDGWVENSVAVVLVAIAEHVLRS